MLALLLLGFSAGLPFLLVFSTLSAWLRDFGISRSSIGFFSWLGITYSIKVFWAPVVDRLPLPLLTRALGQRRSWMLAAQFGIAAGLAGLAMTDPSLALWPVVAFGLLVAFSSATQDIAIDAYRIEAADDDRQGALAAAYIFGYRLALLVAGAGALYIADFVSWPAAYASMAVLVGVGICTTLVIAEPERGAVPERVQALEARVSRFVSEQWPVPVQRVARWFAGAVICPFADFFNANGLRVALLLLALIALYRLTDLAMGVMANPFYLDMGFTKAEIASVAKVFGFGMTIVGSAVGGVLVVRYGIMRVLFAGAVLMAVANLLFAGMASLPPEQQTLTALAVVISADNFSGGLGNVVFIAFLSSLTNRAYTATQYALFSSLMTLLGKFIGGYSGVVVDGFGYTTFFTYAAMLGIPAIILVLVVARVRELKVARENP